MSAKVQRAFNEACAKVLAERVGVLKGWMKGGVIVQSKALDIDEDERSVSAVISTEDIDRDNEVVMLKGLSLTAYRKNPVVLFMHDHTRLIGKSLWQKMCDRQSGKALLAKTKFADTDLAQEVFSLVAGDFMRGTSIGMNPYTVERRVPTPQEIRKRPELAEARMLAKAELIEYSFVTVPANPEALTSAVNQKRLRHTFDIYEPIVRAVVDANPRPVAVVRVPSTVTVKRVTEVRRVAGVKVTPDTVKRCVAFEVARAKGRI